MKRRHRGYILAVALLCLCAMVVHYVSVSTNYWVVIKTPSNTSVHYGLYRAHVQNATVEKNIILSVKRLLKYGMPASSVISGRTWLATVACLSLSIVAILMSFTLAVFNFTQLPASRTMSIWGLCCWMAAGGVLELLALTIWGVEFHLQLKTKYSGPNVETYLGFSYWSQLGVVGLLALCIAILRYRETLFYQKPKFCCPSDYAPPPVPLTVTCGA